MANFIVVQRVENGFAAARRLQKLVLWLLDLPQKGRHVGGGRHVAIAASCPTPTPEKLIGWTTRHVPIYRHPANDGSDTDQFALRITPELQAAWMTKKDQLPAAVRTWLQSHLTSAADLAADWLSGGEYQPEDVLPEE